MIISSALSLAIREIRRNILRSGLTTLGVVIGIAAVIAMVSLGEGATKRVTGDIASLGRNLIIVSPGGDHNSGTPTAAPLFDVADIESIAREIPGVEAVAAVSSQLAVAVYGNANWPTSVFGTDNAYFDVREWSVERGRVFDAGELRAGKAVCVIGATVVEELFGFQDPIGASIRFHKLSCKVIGILDAKGQSSFGQDQDDLIILPLRTFQRRLAGNQDIALIFVSARSGALTGKVQQDIEALMRERRYIPHGQQSNFQVSDMKEIANMVESATGILTAFLGAIAGISLLVGGIGIMNIMLVSVTERTQEIGVRLAIGAMERDVLMQFLVEAIVLSSIGGIFGVGLGLACSAIVGHYLGTPFVFNPLIIVIAVGFSCLVGVVFGYMPARRAARLNPIDALRHE